MGYRPLLHHLPLCGRVVRLDEGDRSGHHRDQPGARAEQLAVFVKQHLAAVVHRDDSQFGAFGCGQLLPRHDVGVVLQVGDDDLVAFAHVLQAPAFGDQVDGFRGAAHEDHFVDFGRVQEALHALAGAFVGVGGARRQRVRGAVDVGVLVFVEVADA
eukprot:gene1481-2078_t